MRLWAVSKGAVCLCRIDRILVVQEIDCTQLFGIAEYGYTSSRCSRFVSTSVTYPLLILNRSGWLRERKTIMDLGLEGKVALVLAGGGGLGRAIAKALAREGAKLAVADISAEALTKSTQDIKAVGVDVLALSWDLKNLAHIEENVRKVEERFGSVDVLVNITGGPPPTPAAGQDPTLWDESFRSMVLSVIAVTDRVLPAMRRRKWGRVITSTSSGVVSPIPNLGISNALRLALVGWSKTLAREVAVDGITSNIIVPGRIETERIRFLDESRAKKQGRSVSEVSAESIASIPVGRYGRPEEYADAVAFLASERASYITGTIMRVDGGLISSI
jgi:3-oxoacyl-[acyl-carrier protein] reductase